ncbi:MAG: YdcF family protein, partial [Firmicutes bacterium]|nr:YdcF family protein [Bacillota bacterium]
YRNGAAPKLLMSGDDGQVEYNEVKVMLGYAVDAGVPEEDIFLDHAGFSTYESMYRARDVFGVSSMVVVTQKYHEYRALYIAESLGIDVRGVPAEEVDYMGQGYRNFRELLARDKDFLKCIVKPKPTFLGDPIDIHGDGTVTQ